MSKKPPKPPDPKPLQCSKTITVFQNTNRNVFGVRTVPRLKTEYTVVYYLYTLNRPITR